MAEPPSKRSRSAEALKEENAPGTPLASGARYYDDDGTSRPAATAVAEEEEEEQQLHRSNSGAAQGQQQGQQQEEGGGDRDPRGEEDGGEDPHPRTRRELSEPTAQVRRDHNLSGHAQYRPWCRACVAACKPDLAHRHADAESRRPEIPEIHCDFCFFRDEPGATSVPTVEG